MHLGAQCLFARVADSVIQQLEQFDTDTSSVGIHIFCWV